MSLCAHHVAEGGSQAGLLVTQEAGGDVRVGLIHNGKVRVTHQGYSFQHANRPDDEGKIWWNAEGIIKGNLRPQHSKCA